MSKDVIKAYLHDNTFARKHNKFVARVKIDRSLTVKDVCKLAIKRDDVDISVEDMEYLVNLWFEEMANLLCNGNSVNAGWFTALPRIKGVFNGTDDDFDTEKHSILFDFSQGMEMRKKLKNLSVKILGMADMSAKITQVTDIFTGSVNNIITPGKNLRIKGSKIKIKGDSKDNGVFFVNQTSLIRTKVDDAGVILNKPSELIIIIPELEEGEYKLFFSSQYTGSVLLKKPRTIEFEKPLFLA